MKSNSGQVQLLAALVFLFLIPATMIIAENATLNLTGHITSNLSSPPENGTIFNGTLQENIAPNAFTEVLPTENYTDASIFANNTNHTQNSSTLQDLSNDTSNATEAPPQGNFTENTISSLNETNASNTTHTNVTGTGLETNQTAHNPDNQTPALNGTFAETAENMTPVGPVLRARLDVPETANRNEIFYVSAEVTNTGDSNVSNVSIEWILPGGIRILDGDVIQYCDIPVNASCTAHLGLSAGLSSSLGEYEIRILVRYSD